MVDLEAVSVKLLRLVGAASLEVVLPVQHQPLALRLGLAVIAHSVAVVLVALLLQRQEALVVVLQHQALAARQPLVVPPSQVGLDP